MKVSEANIQFIKPNDGLVGFASVVVNDSIYLSSIGIHSRLDGNGFRITYPTKKSGNKNWHVFHPISREAGRLIETAILNKIDEVMKKAGDRFGFGGVENRTE